ncbi:Hypp8079 [Branchiostoma lanceolatum]|uniref:Hypp8079 protein n=1 Tax=Branchiostoma lanceolatum TaxID=7740 RepID=A0A8J9Z5I8_BRALA|nr:Hypp8079 [Branchiostoma lanceolatum]
MQSTFYNPEARQLWRRFQTFPNLADLGTGEWRRTDLIRLLHRVERKREDYSSPVLQNQVENMLGFLYFKLNMTKEAKGCLGRVKDRDPTNIIAFTTRGYILLEHNRLTQAKIVLEEFEGKISPGKTTEEEVGLRKAIASGEKAFCCSQLGPKCFKKGIELYENALSCPVLDADCRLVIKFGLGLLLSKCLDENVCGQIKGFDPDSFYGKARDVFLGVVTEGTMVMVARAWLLIGETQVRYFHFLSKPEQELMKKMASHQTAEECFAKAEATAQGKDAFVLERLGRYLRLCKKFTAAIATLEQALELRPTSFAYHEVGLVYLEKWTSSKKPRPYRPTRNREDVKPRLKSSAKASQVNTPTSRTKVARSGTDFNRRDVWHSVKPGPPEPHATQQLLPKSASGAARLKGARSDCVLKFEANTDAMKRGQIDRILTAAGNLVLKDVISPLLKKAREYFVKALELGGNSPYMILKNLARTKYSLGTDPSEVFGVLEQALRSGDRSPQFRKCARSVLELWGVYLLDQSDIERGKVLLCKVLEMCVTEMAQVVPIQSDKVSFRDILLGREKKPTEELAATLLRYLPVLKCYPLPSSVGTDDQLLAHLSQLMDTCDESNDFCEAKVYRTFLTAFGGIVDRHLSTECDLAVACIQADINEVIASDVYRETFHASVTPPGAHSCRYNVFIMYDPKDQVYADELVKLLEVDCGLHCCYESRDFEPGLFPMDNIDRCLSRSCCVLHVVTLTYARNCLQHAEKTRRQVNEREHGCVAAVVYKHYPVPREFEGCTVIDSEDFFDSSQGQKTRRWGEFRKAVFRALLPLK